MPFGPLFIPENTLNLMMDIYRQSFMILNIIWLMEKYGWLKYTCFEPKWRPAMNHVYTNTSILNC